MVPLEFGGLGESALGCALMFEELGFQSSDGGMNFALAAHMLACVLPIWRFGTDEQKRKYLPGLINGSIIAANAITEKSSGSDAFSLAGKAEPLEDGYRLKSHKTYVSNGPVAELLVVYVTTEDKKGFLGGSSCFLLDKNHHSWNSGPVEHKLGLKTCAMSMIELDLEVDRSFMLGREGRGGQIFHESMMWERALLPALYIGTLERLMKKVISFSKQRVSGGQSISKYQAISHKIVDIVTKLNASRMMIHDAARALDSGIDCTRKTSMAKVFVSEFYREAMNDIMQIMGGEAYRGHNEFERHLRDSVAATLYSGTSEIQRNIIAGTLGL